MNRTRQTALTVIAAAALIVGPAVEAQAVTGCNVYHTWESDGRAYVDVFNEAGTLLRLWRGGDSYDYAVTRNRVQKFRIRTNCDGRSQYSPAGVYPYKGGVVYYMSKSGLNLSITTTCLT